MHHFRYTFWLLLVLCCCYGCEKAIEFNLDEVSPKIVVEATIENEQPPRVILTRSTNFFSTISPEILAESFIHDAAIYISNGNKTHRLKEYAIPVFQQYSFYYYSIDSADLNTAFKGELNTSYSLRIETNGNVYTSSTTIPGITRQIDSLWWKKPPTEEDSTKAIVVIRATDPPGFGDYIRYFTKTNNELFLPPFNSVFDDLIIDGTTYELPLEKGVDRNAEQDRDDSNLFNRGDTVTLKISNINKATYDFWRTMEFSYASIGNPFSTPVKVINNISNGALGYFGGYASQYRTIIIPK